MWCWMASCWGNPLSSSARDVRDCIRTMFTRPPCNSEGNDTPRAIYLVAAVSSLALVTRCAGQETKTTQSAPASTLSGLVGYWPCDEGRGNTAVNLMDRDGDLFASGNIGSAVMPKASWAEGKFGKAMRFEGNGPGMAVGYMEALDCDTAVTEAAWIRLDEPHDEGLIWNNERACRFQDRRFRNQSDLNGPRENDPRRQGPLDRRL